MVATSGRARAHSSTLATSYAETYVPEPPYCTYGLRVLTSCVLFVPEAQGSLPRGAKHGTHAVRAPASGVPYVPRTVWCATGNESLTVVDAAFARRHGLYAEGGGSGVFAQAWLGLGVTLTLTLTLTQTLTLTLTLTLPGRAVGDAARRRAGRDGDGARGDSRAARAWAHVPAAGDGQTDR